jgi:hypothetical protein
MSAMHWLAFRGAFVYLPVGHSPHVDLIADFGDELVRVQVKTASHFRHARWEVSLCTRGGNQSWNGIVKRFDPRRCDALFVHVGDGRRWYIPTASLGGASGILLGGPKYATYEIDPAAPLPAREPDLGNASS